MNNKMKLEDIQNALFERSIDINIETEKLKAKEWIICIRRFIMITMIASGVGMLHTIFDYDKRILIIMAILYVFTIIGLFTSYNWNVKNIEIYNHKSKLILLGSYCERYDYGNIKEEWVLNKVINDEIAPYAGLQLKSK